MGLDAVVWVLSIEPSNMGITHTARGREGGGWGERREGEGGCGEGREREGGWGREGSERESERERDGTAQGLKRNMCKQTTRELNCG